MKNIKQIKRGIMKKLAILLLIHLMLITCDDIDNTFMNKDYLSVQFGYIRARLPELLDSHYTPFQLLDFGKDLVRSNFDLDYRKGK